MTATTYEGTQERSDWYGLMVGDPVRERAYRKALALYAPGRVVVDVGAGWGHLTRWALEAGAERVIAIEADKEAIGYARELTPPNFRSRVLWLNALSFDVRDIEGDVIVAEVFDATGVGENALAIIKDARRFMGEGAIAIPSAMALYTCLKYDVRGEPTEPPGLSNRFIEGNLPWFRWLPNEWAPIHCRWTGLVHGLGLAFSLDLGSGIQLSNLPGHPPTHWKQALLTFPEPVPVKAGEVLAIRGRITMTGHDKTDVHFDVRRIR